VLRFLDGLLRRRAGAGIDDVGHDGSGRDGRCAARLRSCRCCRRCRPSSSPRCRGDESPSALAGLIAG
jgi:hypothetical protein